jgi:hypothetical protein
MAELLSNFVWEGTALEMAGVEAVDGHIYKQLDTGESYIHRNGAWQYINLGLAFVKATKSGRVVTDGDGEAQVVFNTPFINDEYSIALSVADDGGKTPIASKYDRLATGFRIRTRNATSGQLVGGVEVSWLCTRDYNP